MSRPSFAGPPISVRLPLTVDAELTAASATAHTTRGRLAARLLTASLAEDYDPPIVVTVGMSGRLFAALIASGAVWTVEVPDAPVNGGVRTVNSAPLVEESELDVEEIKVRLADGREIQLQGPSTSSSRDETITLSPVDLPSAEELAARGGVGTVPGCEHRRFVTVGNFRKCAVCAAVRGLDGLWRAP